jgi:4-amino-4-deoxy-L-arabinose transferase-like glycosyltransferase
VSTADRPPIWLIALLLVAAFSFQGTRGLWEPDEGRYAAAGVNMERSGDWLVPTMDGEHPYLTKPPIVYWALASSFALMVLFETAAVFAFAEAWAGPTPHLGATDVAQLGG